MSAKQITLLIAAVLFQTFTLTAQNYTQHNWYFTGNDQALIFGKSPAATPIISQGKVAQNNIGEKVTATDPTTGDLIFYSDGVNIYDGTHQIMPDGNNIFTDPAAIQGLATSPVPGALFQNQQYIFHRNAAGEILYTVIDMEVQGNRVDGPPSGAVRPAEKNISTGITNRGDGMLVIGSSDMTEFWLLTQDATTGVFELYSIPAPGGTFDAAGNLNLTVDVDAAHFAYHNRTGQIAIIPSNAANVQIIQFLEGGGPGPTLTFSRSILNSFDATENYGGSAGWSFSGQFVYFSRNGTEGGLYRFDVTDTRPEAALETVDTYPTGESLSLQLAPDSTIYHITRETGGGVMQLNRINAPDSAVNLIDYEAALFDGVDPQSDYFSQFSPQRNLQPTITVGVQAGSLCQNTPIQFYPIIDPPTAIPSRVLWDFSSLGIQSEQFAPIITFDQAGPLTGSVSVEINGLTYPGVITGNIEENDLQLSLPDTTICPGEVLTLDAEPQSSGGGGGGGTGGGGGGGTGSYEYLWSTGETTQTIDVTESGDYWVVVTPTGGGCPVYGTGRVTVYGDEGQTANIWYFGNGAGIDFNEEEGLDPPPRSITEAHAMNAPAGTSTISDANGDVLFYTNGTSVWNRENGKMPNGSEIGGDSTAVQSVMIIPLPEDETIYYVFATQEVYGENSFELKYAIVDMKADNGRGDVTLKDITLYANNTERLAAFEVGGGFWLLAHEYGNHTFRSYPITVDGIGNPVLSSAGGIHTYNFANTAQTGMKFSADGQRIAVTIAEDTEDYVELFRFDQTTGEVSEFEYRIDLNEGGPANDEVYDAHFSTGGNKLFVTMNNRSGGSPGGRVLEYRVDSLSTEATRLASRTNIAASSGLNVNFGQIQTGPDGGLYVAVESPGNPGASAFVSQINANEDTAAFSALTPQSVLLTVGNSRLGLPNFVQNNANPQQLPGMSAPDEICVEQRIEMTGSGTSDIDIFVWSITDQSDNSTIFSAEGQDTAYVFTESQAGLYNISLNISNRCGFDTTLVQPIEVLGTPETPTIPQAIALCEGDTQTLDARQGLPNDPTLTYEWTDSQGNVVSTAQTFTVTQREIYTVTVSNALGCSSSGEVFVGPPFEIQLPEASTICQNAPLTLDPQVTANNYIWTVINPDNSTTTLPNQRRATVDSSTPGEYLYVVSIEDPISVGCFVNDTTRVTVNPLAQATAQNIINPACGATNGSFELNLTSTGSYSYTVTGNSAGVVTQGSINGPTTQLINNLGADTYTVTLTDNSSGCVNTVPNIQVQNDPPDFTISPVTSTDADCTNPTGAITVSLDANVFPITYVLTNTTDNTSTSGTVNAAIPATIFDFELSGLSAGTYNLEITSSGGCVQSQTGIVINEPQPVDLTTEPFVEECAATATLTATSTTAGATFSWTGPGGFAAAGGTVSAPQSGTYTVTASAPGSCDVTQDVVVDLTIQPIVQINQTGDVCEGQITLEAEVQNPQPGSTYTYNWSNGATTRTITVDQSGTYTVTARHADNLNCNGNASSTITIPDEIEATLSSSPACDDGAPITLTVDVTAGSPNSFTWTLDGQPIAQTGAVIQVTDEGAYTVNISNGTCFIERSINIRRQAIPEGLLPEVDYYCATRSNNPVLLAGRGFDTYEWTLDGQPYPQGGQTLEVMGPGEYVVTMTTAIGCVRTDTVTIIESCDPEIIAPNAFAPSSPEPNNTFSVFPNDFVDNFEIFIYTRWGELIYQSNTLEFKWDGTFNGELVPIGTYPYVIRFTSRFEPERGVFERKGAVAVIR